MRLVLRLLVVLCPVVWFLAADAVNVGAQGFERPLVVELSDAWFERASQEALMSAVPWKELAIQFFPRQSTPIVVQYQDKSGMITLESDARNRLFDPERARLLFTKTRFIRDARVLVECGSPDECQIRQWLVPHFQAVGLVLLMRAGGPADSPSARLRVNLSSVK